MGELKVDRVLLALAGGLLLGLVLLALVDVLALVLVLVAYAVAVLAFLRLAGMGSREVRRAREIKRLRIAQAEDEYGIVVDEENRRKRAERLARLTEQDADPTAMISAEWDEWLFGDGPMPEQGRTLIEAVLHRAERAASGNGAAGNDEVVHDR